MPLEPNFDHVDQLNPANPTSGPTGDPASEGAPHIRGVKSALKGNLAGDATYSALLVGGVQRWRTEAAKAWHQSDQTAAQDAWTGVLGPLGVALYAAAGATLFGGLRLLTAAGANGRWIVRGTIDGVMSGLSVGKVMAFVDSSIGLGVERDGAPAELVATNAAGAVTLRGVSVENTGKNSHAAVRDAANAKRPVGFNELTTREITAADSVVQGDNGNRVNVSSASAVTLTITAGLEDGHCTIVTNEGAGVLTLTSTETITNWADALATGDVDIPQGGVFTITRRGGGWDVWGGPL